LRLTFVEPAPYAAPPAREEPDTSAAEVEPVGLSEHDDAGVAQNEPPVVAPTPPVVHAPLPGELTDADLEPSPAHGLEEAEVEIVIAPRAPRTDVETLQHIAQRIRNGSIETVSEASTEAPLDRIDAPTAPSKPRAPTPLPQSEAKLDGLDLAKLAHELKTPLTAIASAAEVMRDERLGPMGTARYRDYASDIHHSATHALSVITNMLRRTPEDTTSSETGVPEAKSVHLNALVTKTVATLQPLAAERSITLAPLLTDGDPVVDGDATMWRQIVINLATNALKFTPRGGDVRAVTGYLPDGAVFLAIRDTGAGIAQSDVDAAFEKAADDARSLPTPRAGGGYGLGLPLTINLVRELGAQIDFDSEAGRGTVVVVAFPRAL
jgi:two-component system, cell cycle sensor histidine kinase PleC